MINVAFSVSRIYRDNNIFKNDSPLNRDDCLLVFRLIKEKLESHGCIVNTLDVFTRNRMDVDVIVYNEMPSKRIIRLHKKKHPSAKKHVILMESEIIIPRNFYLKYHSCFDTVFTWSTDLHGRESYIPITFPASSAEANFCYDKKDIFCVLVASNKFNSNKNELYSLRRKFIRFAIQRKMQDFYLYGHGWNYRVLNIKILGNNVNKILKRIKFKKNNPVYKGAIDNKADVQKRAIFSICFENAKNYPGYITEKIHDCFKYGVIPVYYGAPDIADHIPENCFIDFRRFMSVEAVFNHLQYLSQNEINQYRENIENFIKSKSSYKFTRENYVDIICRQIL